MGKIKDAMIDQMNEQHIKNARELILAKSRREKPKPFTVLVQNTDDLQIMWVYAPDGEKVPYVAKSNLIQDARNSPVLEFTVYVNIYGYPTVMDKTIAACNGYGIEMPNGNFFLVDFFSLDIQPDETPMATIKVPCKIEMI